MYATVFWAWNRYATFTRVWNMYAILNWMWSMYAILTWTWPSERRPPCSSVLLTSCIQVAHPALLTLRNSPVYFCIPLHSSLQNTDYMFITSSTLQHAAYPTYPKQSGLFLYFYALLLTTHRVKGTPP